jgi:hypothetical protein
MRGPGTPPVATNPSLALLARRIRSAERHADALRSVLAHVHALLVSGRPNDAEDLARRGLALSDKRRR